MQYNSILFNYFTYFLFYFQVLTYVAEITEPCLRGMLGSTAPTTVIVGTVSQLILGNFYHWRSVVLFNMIFPIIAFAALSSVPESPHWLISK